MAVTISNETNISALLDRITSNKSEWSFGNQLGLAFYFFGDRLFKQGNVVDRVGIRTMVEVRNLELFFEKLASDMLPPLSTPYVEVQLCGNADAYLMYCHSKLHRIEPKRRVLLLGKVALFQGTFNNYYAQSQLLDSGTRVKLYGRTFNIQVSSNQHCIYLRTEDIIKDRVRLEPMILPTDADSIDDEESTDADVDNSDSDETYFECDSDSSHSIGQDVFAGRRNPRGPRNAFVPNRGLIAEAAAAVAPDARRQINFGIRLARFLDAATQTNDEDEDDDDDPPPTVTRQRRHSA